MKRLAIYAGVLSLASTSCAPSSSGGSSSSSSVCNGAKISVQGDGGSISCKGGSVDDCNNLEIDAPSSTKIECGQ